MLGHLQELRKISTKFLNICRNYRLYLLATLKDFDFKRNLRANTCNDNFNEDFRGFALHAACEPVGCHFVCMKEEATSSMR